MPIYRPPKQKPPLGMRLNTAHPLAAQLRHAFVFNERNGILINDLANPGNTGVGKGNGGYLPSWTPDGVYNPGTVDTNTWWEFDPAKFGNFAGANALTIVFRGINDRYNSADDGRIITKQWTWAEADHAFMLSTANWINLRARLKTSTTGGSTFVYTSTEWLDAEDAQFAFRWASGSSPQLYKNALKTAETQTGGNSAPIYGTLISQPTWNGLIGTGADAGAHVGSYGRKACWLYYIYVYTRFLSVDEIGSIYREPYAMFEQPRRVKYFIPAAAGGETSIPPSILSRQRDAFQHMIMR